MGTPVRLLPLGEVKRPCPPCLGVFSVLSCKAKVLCHVWTAGLCQGFALLERQLNILHQNHLQTKVVFINTDNSAFLGGESNFQNLIEKMRLEKGKKKKEGEEKQPHEKAHFWF